MKSLNGKRIATIATGAAFAVAAFAGAAVTGADSLKTLSRSDFVGNGDESQYTIVVGTGSAGEGAAWDAVAAGNIAGTIGNMLYSTGEAVTIDSTSLSDAASSIVSKSKGGVSSTGAQGVFSVTTPSGGVAGASLSLTSYINDYLDVYGSQTRNTSGTTFSGGMDLTNGGVASGGGNPYIITSDLSNGILKTAMNTWSGAPEEEKLFVFAYPYYDVTAKQIASHNTYTTYQAIFDSALTFCRQNSINAHNESDATSAGCSTSDWITRSGTTVTFLGQSWVVADYNDGVSGSEYLKLGKLASGTSSTNNLNKGESIKTSDGYSISLDGVSSSSTSAANNQAIFSFTGPDGTKAVTQAINSNDGLYKIVVGTANFYIKVYTVTVSNTDSAQSKGSASFAVFNQRMLLSNSGSLGGRINGGENGNWNARLLTGSPSGSTTVTGFTGIVVYNTNWPITATTLTPGQSQTLIDNLAQFTLTFNGITTDPTTRDALSFQQVTTTLNVNATSGTTWSGTFLHVHSNQANAFAKGITGTLSAGTGTQDLYIATNRTTAAGGSNVSTSPGTVFYQLTSGYWQNTTALNASATEGGVNEAQLVNATWDSGKRYARFTYYYSSTGKAVIGIYRNMAGNSTVTGTGGNTILVFEVPEWTVDNKESSVIDARDTSAQGRGAFYFAYDDGTGSGQFISNPSSISTTVSTSPVTYQSQNTASVDIINFTNVGQLLNAVANFSWAAQSTPFYSDRGSFVDSGQYSPQSVTIAYGKSAVAHASYTLSTASATSTAAGSNGTVNFNIGDTVYSDGSGVKVVLTDIKSSSGGAGLSQSVVESVLSGIKPSVESADVVHPLTTALVTTDAQASASGKYIVVGGAEVNSLAKDGALPLSNSGDSVIKVSGNRIYVAGYTAADTQEAAKALVDYLNGLRSSSATDTTATDTTTATG